jgi:hypothetical protein
MTYDNRPVKIITAPLVGATGAEMVGVRYLDVPRYEDVPGFPGMQKPAQGSSAIVPVASVQA